MRVDPQVLLIISSIITQLLFMLALQQAGLEQQYLLSQLSEIYGKIEDFQALVTLEPPLSGVRPIKLDLKVLETENILRLEYLAPRELRGQILILAGEELWQYIPVNNTIIKKDLVATNLPLELLGLNLRLALEKLPAGDFSLRVMRGSETNLISSISIASLASGLPALKANALSLSIANYLSEGTVIMLTERISALASGDFILEIIPKRVKTWSRQLIWLDAKSLLPKRLETFLKQKTGEGSQKIITIIESLKINQRLTRDELLRLPQDARIIDTRKKTP